MAGGANRLVSLLSVLDFRLIDARRFGQVVAPVLGTDQVAGGIDRHLRQVRRVGTHVGDMAVLIEPLSHIHCAPRAKIQLAVGLLLQSAGRERLRRLAGVGPLLDVGDAKLAAL
jgi:hypothetical protein